MKEIKVGIVGLGRLGSVHAQNLAFKIPGCKLVAACSLEQKELDWAKDYLKVEYTTTDYKKMVDEADIEAVVIVSSSGALLDDRVRARCRQARFHRQAARLLA